MTFIANNQASLTLSTPGFSDLTLTGQTTDANGYTFTIEADDSSEGGGTTDWGSPQPVDVAVQRWLIDGAAAATQGHDNRTVSFRVVVAAASTAALAAGEAALAVRAGQSGWLTYQPPEGSGVPSTVFDVWTWHLANAYTGAGERNLQRVYDLVFTAKPWTRSAGRQAVAAIGAGTTTTTVDACTSTTGWTGGGTASFGTVTPTVVGGAALKVSHAAPDVGTQQSYFLTLTRTGSVSMTSTPYLKIDMSQIPSAGAMTQTQVSVDGIYMTRVASIGTVSWWQMPAGHTSFSVMTVWAYYIVQPHKTPTLSLTINDVAKTDNPSSLGTGKQLSRSLTVGGAVTTTGSIKVASPSASPLGTVIVYTYPDTGSGYVPAMRSYLTSHFGGSTTVDLTNTVSGAWERIDSALGGNQYTVPPNIFHEATYAVVVRARCATASRQPMTIFSLVSGVASTGSHLLTAFPTFAAANTWEWHVLGTVTLPPQPVPAESSANVLVGINGNDDANTQATSELDLDELYLFDVTNGDLSIATASASAGTRLWIDSADYDPSRNRPVIYQGTQDDRSDAGGVPYFQITALDEHRLDPDGTAIFTVTDGVAGASVSASFYHRWHTHAGD